MYGRGKSKKKDANFGKCRGPPTRAGLTGQPLVDCELTRLGPIVKLTMPDFKGIT